ncbi:MAG: hypothetical protein Q4B43_04435 [Bacteroidota bacterium]|nr:hypothetical protein [Bacteroidota bacterium]
MLKRFFIFWICSLSLACTTNKEEQFYKDMETYFRSKHNYNIADNDVIFALTSNGCRGCNVMLSDYMLSNTYPAVYLISASSNSLDLSEYKKRKGNIFMDWSNDKKLSALFDKSKVIFIKNKQIDTIVQIEAKTLEQTISYIKEQVEHQ